MGETEQKELLDVFLQAAARFSVRKMVCETPHGIFMIDTKDKEIGRSLLVRGEFEFEEKCCWFDFIPGGSDKQFIDIGANIGTTSIPLALNNCIGQVHAFEPDPDNFHLLEYNIGANKLSQRIHAHQCAISNVCGTVRFELSKDNFGDHRVRYQDQPGGSYGEVLRSTIEVPCMTLDEMVLRNTIDLGKIAAIKSDTQGSEGYVLEGASALLLERIPWIIEFWPYGIKRSGFNPVRFCEIVSSSFTTFIEFKPGASVRHRPVNEFPHLFAEYPETSFCNLILLP